MENIMTSRPSRYAVDRSVDPSRSPPSYVSPESADATDAPYSAENIVQPRHSASYTGICLLHFYQTSRNLHTDTCRKIS